MSHRDRTGGNLKRPIAIEHQGPGPDLPPEQRALHDDEGKPLNSDFDPEVWTILKERLTPARRARMEQAVLQRSRHFRLVVQDVHDPHNVSACMRSADAFGVQDVDIVTLRHKFKISTVARGVNSWLTLKRRFTIEEAVKALRDDGYKIVAGLPRPDAVSLYELPVTERTAVLFGNEREGIDPAWLEHVDHAFTIPMVGLVESLNISVSAAITLSHLTRTARESLPPERYFLSPAEQQELLCRWMCAQIPSWRGELEHARRKTGLSPD